jgi:hypothetical protein
MGNHMKEYNTLELYLEHNEVEYSRLLKVLDYFYAFIEDLTTSVAGDKNAIKWNVNMKEGSIRLLNAAYSDYEHAHAIPEIYTCIKSGINALGYEAVRPDKYTDSILKKLRRLASLKKDGINYKIKMDNDEVEIRSDILINNINTVLSWKYEDYGSVEGKLQSISSRGELKFILYECLTDKAVKCVFQEDLLAKAVQSFNKRIYVFGILRYNNTHDPVSIVVQELDVFPDDNDLPTFSEMKGILGD